MLFNLLADWSSYVMIIVLLVAIVGLFIWSSHSNKKRQQEAQDMVNGIKIGDRVKTIGGVCGFVAEINNAENTFVLRTGLEGNESYVKFDKGAIYQTAPAKVEKEVKEEVKVEEKPAPKANKSSKKSKKVEEKPAEETPVAQAVVEDAPAVEEPKEETQPTEEK